MIFTSSPPLLFPEQHCQQQHDQEKNDSRYQAENQRDTYTYKPYQ
jgi:hypothetical protein